MYWFYTKPSSGCLDLVALPMGTEGRVLFEMNVTENNKRLEKGRRLQRPKHCFYLSIYLSISFCSYLSMYSNLTSRTRDDTKVD